MAAFPCLHLPARTWKRSCANKEAGEDSRTWSRVIRNLFRMFIEGKCSLCFGKVAWNFRSSHSFFTLVSWCAAMQIAVTAQSTRTSVVSQVLLRVSRSWTNSRRHYCSNSVCLNKIKAWCIKELNCWDLMRALCRLKWGGCRVGVVGDFNCRAMSHGDISLNWSSQLPAESL